MRRTTRGCGVGGRQRRALRPCCSRACSETGRAPRCTGPGAGLDGRADVPSRPSRPRTRPGRRPRARRRPARRARRPAVERRHPSAVGQAARRRRWSKRSRRSRASPRPSGSAWARSASRTGCSPSRPVDPATLPPLHAGAGRRAAGGLGPGRRRRAGDRPEGGQAAGRQGRDDQARQRGRRTRSCTSVPTRRRSRPSTWWSTRRGPRTSRWPPTTPCSSPPTTSRRRCIRKPLERLVGKDASVQMLDIASPHRPRPRRPAHRDPDRRLARQRGRDLPLPRARRRPDRARPRVGGGQHPHRGGADPRQRHLPRGLFPQLRAALLEVQQRGLADEIHPGEYAGCYYPRFIAGTPRPCPTTPSASPSTSTCPATSAAPSARWTATWWRSSRRGASPGAATGATPTPCTSSSARSRPSAEARATDGPLGSPPCAQSRSSRTTGPADVEVRDVDPPTPGPRRRAGRGAQRRRLLPRPAAEPRASTRSSPSRPSPSASTSPASSSTRARRSRAVHGRRAGRRACLHGGAAERVANPAIFTFPLPDALSYDEGAALPMNYLTAHFALDERGGLREGETVLVHGAAGGVGTATIQVAQGPRRPHHRRRQHRGEGRGRPRRRAPTRPCSVDGFKDAVKELTGGRGVDVVLDVVGGDVFTDSLRCLAEQGRLLVVGFAAGQGIPEVKVNRLLLNNIDVRGVGWGAYAMARPGYMQEQWHRLVPMIERGVVRAADRRDVRARGLRARAASTWTSAARSASRSCGCADPARTHGWARDVRVGAREDPRRRPRGHEPRHPPPGRPVRPRQRPLAGRDRDPGRPVELGAFVAAGRRRRAAGPRHHRRARRPIPPTSSPS